MLRMELASSLVALDGYLDAIMRSNCRVVTFFILNVLFWGNRSIGEVVFEASYFFLGGVSCCNRIIDPWYLP